MVNDHLKMADSNNQEMFVIWIVHGYNNGPNHQPDNWGEKLSDSFIKRYQTKNRRKLVLPYSQSVTLAIISRCLENKNNNCCETNMSFVYKRNCPQHCSKFKKKLFDLSLTAVFLARF